MKYTKDELNNLDCEKKELLLRSLIEKKCKGATHDIKKATSTTDKIPLSSAQKRLWFIDKVDGQSATYNTVCAYELIGDVDADSLESAFQSVMQRHDILRTSFLGSSGEPRQSIADELNFKISHQKIESDSIKDTLSELARKPFDLSKAPLFRVTLLEIGNNQYVLLLVVHHIIIDGWSMHILLKELMASYVSFNSQRQPMFEPLAIQYSDYCVWEQNQITTNVYDEKLKFWKKQLTDLPGVLNLPYDENRPKRPSYNGSLYQALIPNDTYNRLLRVGRQQNTTLFVVLLSIFKILLYRYTGQDDIVIGTSTANRISQNTEMLIGYFVNMLVVRNTIEGNLTFSEVLNRVNEHVIASYNNQDVPLDMVVDAVEIDRTLGYNPLFQIEFVLQNFPSLNLSLPGINIREIKVDTGISKFDMSVIMHSSDNGLTMEVEYNTDIFKEKTIEQLTQHYVNLMRAVIDQPDTPVKFIQFLSEPERHMLFNWSGIEKTVDNSRSFLEYALNSVATFPDRCALEEGELKLSYKDLDDRSNLIAKTLISLEISFDSRVAIFMERSAAFISVMLACSKVGASFTPMNPDELFERNQKIIEHLEPNCIVTDTKDQLTTIRGCVDTSKSIVVEYNELLDDAGLIELPPLNRHSLDDIAYIIYTSGSTGQPKGVMVKQRGMINHLLAKKEDLEVGSDDVVAQIAVQTFDVFVWQCFLAFICGAKTQVIAKEAAWEPKKLIASMQKYCVSILESVPSHIELILKTLEDESGANSLPHFNCLITNGEPMPANQMERWFRLYKNKRLVNAYGPTECSDDVTHLILHKPIDYAMAYLPLGKPIRNTQLFILDDHQQLVPIGVVGEIYISGECVSAGYYKDASQTTRSFLQIELFGIKRMFYKTGDLARYHQDRTIEILGRSDFQMKIRGHRVELGEVESNMLKHPQISQAVVVGKRFNDQRSGLIAYVVISDKPAPSEGTLKKYFTDMLPRHLTPDHIIVLDQLPLLSNGKINRKLLPEPLDELMLSNQEYVPPTSDMEHKIVKIWQEVLGKSRVGVEDNFFHLGGHSLMAIDLVEKMKIILGDDVSLETLFTHLSIRNVIRATQKNTERV